MERPRRVVAIYTAPALVEPCKAAFQSKAPWIELVNIVDDRLIFDINARGSIDAKLESRTMSYFSAAESCEADAILCTCSSIGEIAAKAAKRLTTPVIRIDGAMVEAAVEQGTRIGVLATLASTLDPTVRFIEETANRRAKEVRVVRGLAAGAYEAASAGDVAAHDASIMGAAMELVADGIDVLVLAQGSMARMASSLSGATGVNVLSSLDSGIEAVMAGLRGSEPAQTTAGNH